jgi:hypothetical protein
VVIRYVYSAEVLIELSAYLEGEMVKEAARREAEDASDLDAFLNHPGTAVGRGPVSLLTDLDTRHSAPLGLRSIGQPLRTLSLPWPLARLPPLCHWPPVWGVRSQRPAAGSGGAPARGRVGWWRPAACSASRRVDRAGTGAGDGAGAGVRTRAGAGAGASCQAH